MTHEKKMIYDLMLKMGADATDPYFVGLWAHGCGAVDLSNWPTVIDSYVHLNGMPQFGQAIQTIEVEQEQPSLRDEYLLSWRNRTEQFRLPVNPVQQPSFSEAHHNHTFDTVEVGSFKAIGRRGLIGSTLESFFPARHASFCVVPPDELLQPMEYIEMLKRWKRSDEPIRLIITGYVNEAFAVERIEWHKEMGTNDIFFTLDLEEYRFDEQVKQKRRVAGNLDPLSKLRNRPAPV